MIRISFILKSKSNPSQIYVRVTEGKKIDLTNKTPFFINPFDWDKEKKFPVMRRDETTKILVKGLTELRNRITESYWGDYRKINIDKNWLDEIVFPVKNEKSDLFTSIIQEYIEFINRNVQKPTIQKFKRVLDIFNEIEKTEKKIYRLKDLDIGFRVVFSKYSDQKKYSSNYRSKLFDFIKTVWNFSVNQGKEHTLNFGQIKFKKEVVNRIFLNFEEIEKIKKCTIYEDRLDNVRDWLVIGCYTGVRVSDLLNMNKSKIYEEMTNDGEKIRVISLVQQKTQKRIWIPIPENGNVQKILNKRNGDFPKKISSQKFNDYIKEVGELSGINEMVFGSLVDKTSKRKKSGYFPKYQLITSHICRRSFSTNYYGIIPTSSIKELTGHSKEADLLTYIGKSPKENLGFLSKKMF